MKKVTAITCVFLGIGGVLLTDGWGHVSRKLKVRYGLNIFRVALDIAQVPANQVVYIENLLMFFQVAEGLGIRGICHTDYKSTCAKLASFGLEVAE